MYAIFWTAQEIDLDKDTQDYKTNMTPKQFKLVSFTLQIFVEIEQKVGSIWNTIASWFPHSEIEGACIVIASMETSVHAFFYQKMNDALNISPEDIKKNQEQVYELSSKLKLLEDITSDLSSNKALSLATVSIIEQVMLFSNFAMLKTFQANGYNLISSTITGIDLVKNDEDLHGEFAAYLFNTYTKEANTNKDDIRSNIVDIIEAVVEHEFDIIDLVFGDNVINHTTSDQLKEFVKHRANRTLDKLGFKEHYTIKDTYIQEWFYRGNNSMKIHDFFVSGTSSYRRGWIESNLTRSTFVK